MKRWTPLFDLCTERYDTLPIWVKMSNLPFEFWSLDFFKLVGNSLGTFLEANLSFLHSSVCCLGKILVLLDISKGLVADLMISKGNISFKQPLEYVGVPFKCLRCHRHGHLAFDCSLYFHHKSGGVVKSVWRVKKSVGSNGCLPEEGLDKLGVESLEDGSRIHSETGLVPDVQIFDKVHNLVSNEVTTNQQLYPMDGLLPKGFSGLHIEEQFLSLDVLKPIVLDEPFIDENFTFPGFKELESF